MRKKGGEMMEVCEICEELLQRFINGQLLVQNLATKQSTQGEIRSFQYDQETRTLKFDFNWLAQGSIIGFERWRISAARELNFHIHAPLVTQSDSGNVVIDPNYSSKEILFLIIPKGPGAIDKPR